MYKAKRNVTFEGKYYERGKEYVLTQHELVQIGVDFELVPGAEPVAMPEPEPTPVQDEGEEVAEESEKPKKKAKRK